MESVRPDRLRLGDLTLEGCSRAGEESWLRVHPPGLGFDAGRGALALAGARDLFITHGHLDHALGVPFVLSQRSLHQSAATRVFCPREVAGDLEAFVAAAARLERVEYDFTIEALAPGDRVEVGRDLAVEAFATDHVVPSLGFFLVRTKRRLAPEYHGLEPAELVDLRRRGISPEVAVDEDWLAYCGDTGPEVFEREPRLYRVKVLVVECTFLGEALRTKGARYKHVHLEDLAERASHFGNDALVLCHLSRRHTSDELRAEVARAMPALAPRVHLFG